MYMRKENPEYFYKIEFFPAKSNKTCYKIRFFNIFWLFTNPVLTKIVFLGKCKAGTKCPKKYLFQNFQNMAFCLLYHLDPKIDKSNIFM